MPVGHLGVRVWGGRTVFFPQRHTFLEVPWSICTPPPTHTGVYATVGVPRNRTWALGASTLLLVLNDSG